MKKDTLITLMSRKARGDSPVSVIPNQVESSLGFLTLPFAVKKPLH